MNKEDYYKRIEDKLDKQTLLLMSIDSKNVKEISLLKLADQKIRYGFTTLTAIVFMLIAIEYPKLVRLLKGLL